LLVDLTRPRTGPPGRSAPRAGSSPVYYYSIRINDQWRITFRIEDDPALDVTIEDYN
jgi:plasmid maintenance system killer protein